MCEALVDVFFSALQGWLKRGTGTVHTLERQKPL